MFEFLPRALCVNSLFCYNCFMKVEINARGNGACPICKSSGNCRVQDVLTQSMAAFSQSNNPMELVVYSCPQFMEKTERE